MKLHRRASRETQSQLGNYQTEFPNEDSLHLSILLSMKINLRRKLRLDMFVSLKSFVGNDERESDLYRRPGDLEIGWSALPCSIVNQWDVQDTPSVRVSAASKYGWQRITRIQ